MDVRIEHPPLTPEQTTYIGEMRKVSISFEWFMAHVEERAYSVIAAREDISGGDQIPDERWHISIAGEEDVPSWGHLAAIAHRVRPGVPLVVGVPPKSWWLNVHPHTLHLFETKDPNLVAQWRHERQGHTPT